MVSKTFRILSLITILFFIITPTVACNRSSVLVLEIFDPIGVASDDIIKSAIRVAERERYEALVIKINTPGGRLDETFRIVRLISDTHIPVIGFVYPEGATAWSAGTMILIGTDIAAMGPHTIIGSMQPVAMTPEGPRPIDDPKIIHALVEFARERAVMHDRNATLAEEFITKNRNVNDTIALKYNVIEFRANDLRDLLIQIDGKVIEKKDVYIELNTKNADIINHEIPLSLTIMLILSNPMIAGLLIMLGINGILFSIGEPGGGGEVFGIIAIVLGLIGMGFEVNIAAIFLIIIGFVLILIEFRTPGFGIFGIAGLLGLIMGSVLLPLHQWDAINPDFAWRIIMAVTAPTLVISIFVLFVVYKVIQARRLKPMLGSMIGEMAETVDIISPDRKGFIRYKGEYWKAISDKEIGIGKKVKIIEKNGVVLIVQEVKEKDGK